MSFSMTPAEVGVLAEFSAIPSSERGSFLQQHPELRSTWVADWALTAAHLRGRMGEHEAPAHLTKVALYIATELDDNQRQAAARELLIQDADQGLDFGSSLNCTVAGTEAVLSEAEVENQGNDDRVIPPRPISQRVTALAKSAAALSGGLCLGTAIRLLLQHPHLLFRSIKQAVCFVDAAIEEPTTCTEIRFCFHCVPE